jgi:hypothetical protein
MSQRQSGYERKALDFYATPAWVTEALVGHVVARPGLIWEPACGDGQMVNVLKEQFVVLATDINNTGLDFLAVKEMPNCGIRGIITNPPYDKAEEFCAHALELTKQVGGYVAMLLRCDFDHAKSRSYLFRDHPAWSKKLVLTKRIVWFVEEDTGKPKASPSFNHAWYVWDHKHGGPPTIGYAP